MLWLLICVFALVGGNRIAPQDSSYMEREDVTVMTRPHIYYCRSPNMEDFTCWWHPLDNVSSSRDDVTYVLTYSIDKEPMHECPDYVTGGPHSCHFDKRHTSVWTIYCMTVTAVTPFWNYTSHERCLDVADIVQVEAPVNLTYSLSDAGEEEVGHNARLSWAYPAPSALENGWITLIYELQYRHMAQPHNWKVKQRLRESHIELLGLPVGDYVVRVRCRSRNSELWSRWSPTLTLTIPTRPPAGKMLVLILMTGFGMVVLLAIGFGIIPQSKRIRAYFLPPIPKPHIIGIDPLLLKMGHIEEINRHFSSFHGYRPPSYEEEEVWDHLSTATDDSGALATEPDPSLSDPGADRQHLQRVAASDGHTPSTQAAADPLLDSKLYVRCAGTEGAWEATGSAAVPCPWPPGIVFLPGSDYSTMGVPPVAPAAPAPHSQPDFYTCVQVTSETGEVHLVPCLSPTPAAPAGGEEAPAPHPMERVEQEEEEEEKRKEKRQAERQAEWQAERHVRKTAPSQRGDVTAPPLPVDYKG